MGDLHSRNLQSIKHSIVSLGQQTDQAKARIESIRSAIDVDKQQLLQSSNITNSFSEVCQAHLQGFNLRMAQREAVQKKAEEAITWFTKRAEEIKNVMAKLNQPQQQAKDSAAKPPVAAQNPPSAPAVVLQVVQKELPSKPDSRFRSQRKDKGQQQGLMQAGHARAHARFRYVPAYTNQKEVQTVDREELEKELSDEFNSQLQTERERLSQGAEKVESAVRVGFKLQAGT